MMPYISRVSICQQHSQPRGGDSARSHGDGAMGHRQPPPSPLPRAYSGNSIPRAPADTAHPARPLPAANSQW